jgi:hypothetical protein
MAPAYTDPIPGATIGRTDQGVDATLAPGKPIDAPGLSKIIGIIPNWYQGQPFIWGELLNGPDAGHYWYAAEQLTPTVKPGQIVQGGQPVAIGAKTGTGLELGWATKAGQTLARATTGYTEGQATTAGTSFRNFLSTLGSSGSSATTAAAAATTPAAAVTPGTTSASSSGSYGGFAGWIEKAFLTLALLGAGAALSGVGAKHFLDQAKTR